MARFPWLLALSALSASLSLLNVATAHPGETHAHGASSEQRALLMTTSKRLLANCASSEASRRLRERTVAHRAAMVDQLRRERRGRSRQLDEDTVLATSHKSSRTGLTNETDPSELFGSNVSCILEPEVTQGPYYVSGELVRNDVRENQAGVDLYADLQVIDVNTCEPVENLYLDFWHCNATGVYSGVVASSNGDSSDTANLNNTFMRGLYPTDADGVASFTTKFPGHYRGRAIHIHVLGTYNGTLLDNNTYSGGYASHVGQIFFDQDLIAQVETTSPYTTNTARLTTNEDDSIFSQSTDNDFDPVMQYVLLGDDVSDGILAWISIGVDMTQAETITPAVKYTGDGGADPDPASGGNRASGPGTSGGGSAANSASANAWSVALATLATCVLVVF